MARMTAILADIPGLETAARNPQELPRERLPAASLYDGDEESAETMKVNGVGGVVYTQAQVVISVVDVPETVGTTANGWRARVINAILLDDALQALCGEFPNKGIKYSGCSTTLAPGYSSIVNLTLNFTAAYQFKPTAL